MAVLPKIIPALLAAWLAAGLAQAHDDPVENQLHELLDAFLAGASRNDVAMHDRFWADDLVYTSSNGERRSKAEIMTGLRSATATPPGPLPDYRGEDVNIRVFDDFAVITFRLVADNPDGSTGHYFNTGVFRRTDGAWKAFTWQATRIPDATD